MSKQNSLIDHFKDVLLNNLKQSESITELLSEIGINNEKVDNIVKSELIDDNRVSVLVETKTNANGEKSKVIFDAILGEPTWKQMMDVTFERGHECEKKIIIYFDINKSKKSYIWSENSFMAVSFAKINNDCGVDTYIVSAKAKTNDNGSIIFKYYLEEEPGDLKVTSYTTHPNKKDFQQAELWLSYNNFIGDYPPQEFNPNNWMDGPWRYESCDIDFKPIWNDQGLFIVALTDSDNGRATLKRLLETNIKEIENEFKDHKLNVVNKSEVPSEISIRMHERPFNEFVGATPADKDLYVEELRSDYLRVFDFFDNLILR